MIRYNDPGGYSPTLECFRWMIAGASIRFGAKLSELHFTHVVRMRRIKSITPVPYHLPYFQYPYNLLRIFRSSILKSNLIKLVLVYLYQFDTLLETSTGKLTTRGPPLTIYIYRVSSAASSVGGAPTKLNLEFFFETLQSF